MKANGSTTELASNDKHDEIAFRAYLLWQERGSPIGSPEDDWFGAEREICGQTAELTQTCDCTGTQAQTAAG
jgi:hypothetical protein